MNRQNAYNAWEALGLTSQYNTAPYGLSAMSAQQAALGAGFDMQHQAIVDKVFELHNAAMQNYLASRPEAKESRAQRMAKEVRERNPNMQVQRRTRREA